MSSVSPVELIDISSSTDELFVVEDSDIIERFRIGGPPTTRIKAAFMGAATTSRFPDVGSPHDENPMQIDTRGSSIETELHSLMGSCRTCDRSLFLSPPMKTILLRLRRPYTSGNGQILHTYKPYNQQWRQIPWSDPCRYSLIINKNTPTDRMYLPES